VHLSVQRTHVHLLVEASGKVALARGMQGFQISAAKHINAAISEGRPGPRRKGAVFPDRYHAEIITSPRQARHALSYVSNWRKHGEDRREVTRGWRIDWFSSAVMFPDWTEYGDAVWLWRGPQTYERCGYTGPVPGCCGRAGNAMARRSRVATCRVSKDDVRLLVRSAARGSSDE
jgi:hypothetical protein